MAFAEDVIISVDSPAHDKADHLAGESGGYSWEEEYKRSWDVLQEDDNGLLSTAVDRLTTQLKRRRLNRDTRTVHRGIIRHLVIVVDLSESILEKDLKPSRLELTRASLELFILEYFDQNPISQLSIVITRDALAEIVTELSGNPGDHIHALRSKKYAEPRGEPSLQNALEMARGVLSHVPNHGTREILCIFSSMTTCDPGNIRDTIRNAVGDSIRISMIGLAAEIHICKLITTETRGTFSVVLNEHHYKELLFEHVAPPPLVERLVQKSSNLMQMGFPERVIETHPSLCACHGTASVAGYKCPQCASKLCQIPIDCVICGLTLVSSPHLARSYHHLFPLKNFVEVTDWAKVDTMRCVGCQIQFEAMPPPPGSEAIEAVRNLTNPILQGVATSVSGGGGVSAPRGVFTGRYQCASCQSQFCIDCDVYLHEVVHCCPGCCMTRAS
ncbi:hypothetical protein RI367_006592 [Sorochytrium milnesiophthora]